MEAKEEAKPEIDEQFWELLMSAEKKDYEGICAQYGVTDFRGMLKKLNEKKIEREFEQEKVCFIVHVFQFGGRSRMNLTFHFKNLKSGFYYSDYDRLLKDCATLNPLK